MGLDADLGSPPFPEQLSFAADGTLLARVTDTQSRALLIRWSPIQGRQIVDDGAAVGGYTIRIVAAPAVSGVAISNGRAFADVRAYAQKDSPEGAGRSALLAIDGGGVVSLPVVQGHSTAQAQTGEARVVSHFASPFSFARKRNTASDSGGLTFIGFLENEEGSTEEGVLLLTPNSFTLNRADFDGNGVVAVSDLFAFLRAYFNGDSRADMDGNGVIGVADIFDFLSHYFAR